MPYQETILKELYHSFESHNLSDGLQVNLKGWVRTNRNNGSIGFIELSDGTTFLNVQLVYSKDQVDDFDSYSHYLTGSSLSVNGEVKLTPNMKQPFEIRRTGRIIRPDGSRRTIDQFGMIIRTIHLTHIIKRRQNFTGSAACQHHGIEIRLQHIGQSLFGRSVEQGLQAFEFKMRLQIYMGVLEFMFN